MRLLIVASVAAAARPAPACTAPSDPAAASAQGDGRECFHADSASSFTPVRDDAVVVRVGANRYYRLEFVGTCHDIDWSQRIALRTQGSAWICRGHDADILVRGPQGTDRCPVRAVRRLTGAEVEALRDR